MCGSVSFGCGLRGTEEERKKEARNQSCASVEFTAAVAAIIAAAADAAELPPDGSSRHGAATQHCRVLSSRRGCSSGHLLHQSAASGRPHLSGRGGSRRGTAAAPISCPSREEVLCNDSVQQ